MHSNDFLVIENSDYSLTVKNCRQTTIRFCIKEFTMLGADPVIIYAQP